MEIKTIEERTSAYLNVFEAIHKRVGDERLAAMLLQEIAKDLRMDRMEKNGNGNGKDKPATEKQIAYLKSLGVEAKPGLTKREASLRIDQHNGVKSE
jgi:hypothetical protein